MPTAASKLRQVDSVDVLRRSQGGISPGLTRAMNGLRIGDLAGERPGQTWLDGTIRDALAAGLGGR